jgi:quercetin dioxygenase-like cupin family protein
MAGTDRTDRTDRDRAQIESRLRGEGLSASSWGNGPGDRYSEHRHDYDKVLVAVAGSIVFHAPASGRDFELRPGDRLDLPAGTGHAATVGPQGVTCLEAHVPAGTLPALTRRAAGKW